MKWVWFKIDFLRIGIRKWVLGYESRFGEDLECIQSEVDGNVDLY